MKQFNLDSETINQLGLRQSSKSINAEIAPDARVFEYPGIDHVYVMERDLYGNAMPEGSCFLAFDGRVGLMGKHIRIDTLLQSSKEDIKKIVNDNHEG
jgi:hypothetical protein